MPVILDELENISIHLNDEEVARAKAQIRASLLMSLESPATRATQLARHLLLFGRYITPEEQIERMNAITKDDIQKVAQRVFSTSHPTLSAIGPVANILRVGDVVNRLQVLQAAE